MPRPDASFDALREAITALADQQVGELVAEAEAEARDRVRASLSDAIASALLDRSTAELAARYLADDDAPRPRSDDRRDSDREGARAHAPGSSEGSPPTEPAPGERGASRVASNASEPTDDEAFGGEATYVFGVADRAGELEDLEGFDAERPVRALRVGPLAAIVATVDLAEFGEQALARNLEDLEWIERAARRHEAVLGALARRATIVPMRLCTIYGGDEQVLAMLGERSEEFSATLERLRGRTEWGVKLIAVPGALERAAEARGEPEDPGDAELSPGLAYLGRKQRQQRARGDIEAIAAELAGDAHERLAAVADGARLNKLQARELGGHDGDMILNAAYLVADDRFDRFEGALGALRDELARDDVETELTGPWPAYNFAVREDDEILRVAG